MSSTLGPADLEWRRADASDVSAIQRFVCADPPKRTWDFHRAKKHPFPWELEVQSHIRSLNPGRLAKDEALLVGMRNGEIVSATHICFDIEAQNLMVLAIATQVEWRRRGISTVGLEWALDVLDQTRLAHRLDCFTMSRIHPENEPSQRLFTRFGFRCVGPVEGPGLDVWVL